MPEIRGSHHKYGIQYDLGQSKQATTTKTIPFIMIELKFNCLG